MQRRTFAAGLAAWATASTGAAGQSSQPSVQVEFPRCRVPLSFIIDDSTCLVNMGKYCMPQFAATYPGRKEYQKPWRSWPDEIPDSFVREFGSWCSEHGVKGKYSIVPYPACVGWLDRCLPGWSDQQLRASLKLVRELMLPNWDIHPEMISHTRVIDLKTGRPYADNSPAHMENSYPQEDLSVDHLASYLAYALKILKNCELPCEGITTPGGFGNRVKDKLPLAVFEAVRDVYGTDLPHYFKYVSVGDESTEPALEGWTDDPQSSRLVMQVPAGTGDWFGGWDGALASQGDKYCNADASSGRMVELIEAGRPAVMLCHWPGMYCGGGQQGYHDFQRVVLALNHRFKDQTQWMKISEMGRYWAARERTAIEFSGPNRLRFQAPYACPQFTVTVPGRFATAVYGEQSLKFVTSRASLQPGCLVQEDQTCTLCIDLTEGLSEIHFA